MNIEFKRVVESPNAKLAVDKEKRISSFLRFCKSEKKRKK